MIIKRTVRTIEKGRVVLDFGKHILTDARPIAPFVKASQASVTDAPIRVGMRSVA
jgi:hypothetical protein